MSPVPLAFLWAGVTDDHVKAPPLLARPQARIADEGGERRGHGCGAGDGKVGGDGGCGGSGGEELSKDGGKCGGFGKGG
eukprot:7960956-Karenia_brevis.AAC.1